MKIKTYLLNLDKPSKNNTIYSKQVVENNMENLIGKPVTVEFQGEKVGTVEDVYLEAREDNDYLVAVIHLDEGPQFNPLGSYGTSAIVDNLKYYDINGVETVAMDDLEFVEVSSINVSSQYVPNTEMYKD